MLDEVCTESSKKPPSSKEFEDSSARPRYEDRGLGRGNREVCEMSERRPELELSRVEAAVLSARDMATEGFGQARDKLSVS